jgi:hypothetical protein
VLRAGASQGPGGLFGLGSAVKYDYV